MLVHQNTACFADQFSCEQLSWQSHRLSVLKKSFGDTYFIAFDKNGFPLFHNKKIININPLADDKIFIDKTGSGYGMSCYMAYNPEQKTGVIILTNKFLDHERIKLGRDIIQTVTHYSS